MARVLGIDHFLDQMYVFENFLSDYECDLIIKVGEPLLEPSTGGAAIGYSTFRPLVMLILLQYRP